MAPNDPEDLKKTRDAPTGTRRLRRWFGRIGLAWQWVRSKGLETSPKRTWMSIIGVAMAVALLVSVTGLAIGIASPVTGTGDSDEYWIVPETGGESSPLVATDEPQFGSVHEANEEILRHDYVDESTPILMEVVQVESDSGETEYVLALGVIPSSIGESVLGISTEAMSLGDPYADNSSDPPTGDIVLSDGAATLLEAEEGSELSVVSSGSTESVTTTDVDRGDGDGVLGATPVVVMKLSELQTLTGAAEHDQADQFLVQTNSSSAADDLDGLYSESEVRSSSEMATQQVLDSELALALSLTAVLVSVFVGTLFIGTTMVLELIGNRSQLTSLHAMGIGLRSQLSVYAVQTVIIAAIGGFIGGFLGVGTIRALNMASTHLSTVGAVAIEHPLFPVYGFGVAIVIGLITIPILWVTLARLDIGGEQIRG